MAKQKQPEYRINLRPYRILYWPFLLPVALLLALFNKISPVPFKIYVLRVDRVGQMAGNQEELCCELDLGMHPREFRVFVHRDHPSNGVLLDMQKRILPIHNVFLPLFDVCHKLGGLGVSSMDIHKFCGADRKHLTVRTSIHLSFSEEEEREARRQCRELGIDPDKPVIPVLGRDATYLESIKEPTDRDSYRNVDINTFVPAMEHLAESFQVVRMGSVVLGPLDTNHPGILDYSLSGKRSELLDIYLSARCHFFFSSATGLDSIASACFRLPVLYVDFIPFTEGPIMKPGCIFIPKKYWHTKEERYLTTSELVEGPGRMYTPRELNPLDIVVHDNTPEEILDAAREMVARLDGTWVDTPEDEERQERFWSHFRKKDPQLNILGRIGSEFLKNNPYWLD